MPNIEDSIYTPRTRQYTEKRHRAGASIFGLQSWTQGLKGKICSADWDLNQECVYVASAQYILLLRTSEQTKSNGLAVRQVFSLKF